jgi:hypothetical protein
MKIHESVKGPMKKYQDVRDLYGDKARDVMIADSVRDIEAVVAHGEGDKHALEDQDMTNIELREASEVEQDVPELTGLSKGPYPPHPDGSKDVDKDGDDHKFGKSWTIERPIRPTGG